MLKDTRTLQFDNLVDAHTGQKVTVKVPIGWQRLGEMIHAGVDGTQEAKYTLKVLSNLDPDETVHR